MGKILSYIEKESGGKFVCYKTKKLSLDVNVSDTIDYDDKNVSTALKSKFAETDHSLKPTVKIPLSLLQIQAPIFTYFLDGSRHTFKVDDIGIGNKIYPIVAGQIVVGCCERKSRDIFKKYEVIPSIVISLPSNFDDDDGGENFCRLYCENLNNTISSLKFIKDRKIHISKLLLYPTEQIEGRSKDNYLSRAIAKIQNEMTDQEQVLVAKLCKENKLDDEHWLIKDGSIEYNPQFTNLDITSWNQLRSNYGHVIGISKQFNPELLKDYQGKKLSKTIANLQPYERTKVYVYSSEHSGCHFAVWYVRLRNSNFRETHFSDIVKCEMLINSENDLVDTDKIDILTANIIREAYPVCYGKDSRWANHLYPVFLTETFCKSNYISDDIVLNLF